MKRGGTTLETLMNIDYADLELRLLLHRGLLDEEDLEIIKSLSSWRPLPKVRHTMQKLERALEATLPASLTSGPNEAAQKVLTALASKPDLAWQLTQDLNRVVLSPWKWAADGQDPPKGNGEYIKGHRDYPTGSGVVACCVYQIKLQESHDSWSWAVFARGKVSGEAIDGKCGTQEEATRIVDGHLEARGFILGR